MLALSMWHSQPPTLPPPPPHLTQSHLTNLSSFSRSHLLDKIQALGQKSLLKKGGTLDGEPLVAPIKRRLLV